MYIYIYIYRERERYAYIHPVGLLATGSGRARPPASAPERVINYDFDYITTQ